MKRLIAGSSVVLAICCVQAQPVYKCGPGGTEYSQIPCPGGKVLESTDPRTAAQRAEAARVAERERRRAAELERERRTQQAGLRPARAAGFNGRPQAPDTAASSPERGKQPRRQAVTADARKSDFVAVEPGSKRKRKRS